MASNPKKKRWRKRVLFSLLGFFILLFTATFFLLQSPRFLLFVIQQLNHSIPGTIAYESLDLNLETRTLRAQNLSYQNEQGQTAFSVDSLDLGFALTSALRGRLHIRHLEAEGLNFYFKNFPKREGPSQWRMALRLILKRISMAKSKIGPVDLFFSNDAHSHLEGIQMVLTKQILENQRIDLKVAQTQTKVKDTTVQTGPLEFVGELDFPIIKNYPYVVRTAKGELKAQDISLPHVSVGNFDGKFRIKGGGIIFEDGTFENEHGKIKLDVVFNPDKPSIELELKNDEAIPMAAIPRASERLKKTIKAFKVDLKIDLDGFPLEKTNGEVDLVVDGLGNRAHDQTPDHKLTLKGKIKNGVLTFTLFEIKSEEMELKAQGNVNFAKQAFDVKVTTKDFDVTTLVNTLADIDLTGNANAEGTIKGTFKNPNFYIEVDSKGTGYSFLNFDHTVGTFKIENGTLSFVGGSPQGTEYFTEVNVKTTDLFKKSRQTFLKTQFKNMDVGSLLRNPEIKGKIDGTFELEVLSSTQKSGDLQAKIKDFLIYDFHFTEIEAEGKLLNNQFILNPITFQPPDYDKFTVPEPTVFKFDDRGWTIKGVLIPGVNIEGKFLDSNPNAVQIEATLKNVNLEPILASLLIPPTESYVDGSIKMSIGLEDRASTIDINFSNFVLPLEEGEIRNDGPLQVEIRPPQMNFKRFVLLSGGERFTVKGNYTLDGPINLDIDGKLNLAILKYLPQYFREGSGFAQIDMKLGGNLEKPRASGQITFSDANVTLRPVRGEIEDLNGTVKLTGNSVVFEKLHGIMREGDLTIDGRVDLENLRPKYYDLTLDAREVAISDPGVYKVIFSGDFKLKGPAKKAVFSGIMNITDGAYTRDFNITQFILKPQEAAFPEQKSPFLKNIQLDLQVRSPGELAIKNNVANMFFNSDLQLTGPADNPKVSGAIEVLDGKFHYFTIDFEGAHGFVDFRDPKKGPYVDIAASKEFESSFASTVVTTEIKGFTDNLQISFTSDPPLPRRDIISLVFTGALPGGQRGFSGTNIASTLLAAQLSQVIQKPLAQKAHLDIFRLEASDPDSTSITTLVFGKRLTDRLSLEFKTDLGASQPQQGVQMEYKVLDNVLLKGVQFSDGEFDFDLAWRLKLD